MTNIHWQPIKMQRVIFTSHGDRETSGLGDIIGYWPWKDAERSLGPGEDLPP